MSAPTTITKIAAALNSRRYGEVCTAEQLRTLLVKLGIDPGKGGFPLLKLISLLLQRIGAKKPTGRSRARTGADDYLDHLSRTAKRQKNTADEARNIGQIPPPFQPQRKEECRLDLQLFMLTYFPGLFYAGFSEDHKEVIQRIQTAILDEGWLLEAVYRGFGKSTIAEIAVLWAVIYGHRRFCLLVGKTSDAAEGSMGSIRMQLEQNELLAEDFPEVCLPLQALEGITQRAKAQTYTCEDGSKERTYLKAEDDELRFPVIEGSACAGSVIICYGIESSKARGLKRMIGRENVRPDFVFFDDPQSDESAISPQQVAKTQRTIERGILGSSGHFRGISCFMACTVIAKDDLVERLLDQSINPKWVGKRRRMVQQWSAAHETLWPEYAAIRRDYTPGDLDSQKRAVARSNEMYASNRQEMDLGAVVSWDGCYSAADGELSAIQHAYNIYYDKGDAYFASECQNEPLSEFDDSAQIEAADVLRKCSGLKRMTIPETCTVMTLGVDIMHKALYYILAVWEPDFTGYVVDYGAFPNPKLAYYTLSDIKYTLKHKFPNMSTEAAVTSGLSELIGGICESEYPAADGGIMTLDRALIDANEGQMRKTVFEFCRRFSHRAVVLPSVTVGTRASHLPFDEGGKKGDVKGLNWRKPKTKGRGEVRHILSNVNFWKSFIRDRIKAAPGEPGSLYFFGKENEGKQHAMLADHLTAERFERVAGSRQVVDEWMQRPGVKGVENHFFDCLVMAAIAASEQGCALPGSGAPKPKKGRRSSVIPKGWWD